MRAAPVLLGLLLAATVLAIVPAAQASVQPCPTYAGGCCPPSFAPCTCFTLLCRPPVVSCPSEQVGTDEVLRLIPAEWIYGGPHAEAWSHSGCQAGACESADPCGPADCSQHTATCCQAGLVMSDTPCTCEPQPIVSTVAGTASTAIPVPGAAAGLESDCSVTVTETWSCPGVGLVDAPVHYDAGPVQASAMLCAPMCACIPLEASTASANLPPIGPPCPSMGGCCGIEPPEGGCGGLPGVPSVPPCPVVGFGTNDLKPIGPVDPSLDGVAVATTSSCKATATENDGFLACPHDWAQRHSTTVAGPATANTTMCEPEIECTCDPLLAPLLTPSMEPVCAQQSVTSVEATVTLRQDCSVLVAVHDAVTCSRPSWWPGTFDRQVGGEEARVTFCLPEVASASSASAIQQPIGVTFVYCVRGPCPPEVWCAPRYADEAGLVTYQVEGDCDVIVSQDPAPCEAWHYDSTTVGPLTLRQQHCDPGIQP
jgi:hypothetical protein